MRRLKAKVGYIARLRMTKFYLLGNAGLVVNFIVFNIGMQLGLHVVVANAVSYFVGGQVNFWVHDRMTFGDRNPELGDWHYRWLLFMAGNMSALGVNTGAAWVLNYYGQPHLIVYGVAMGVAALFNFAWNNFVSHRDRGLSSQPQLSVERSQAV